MIKVVIVDDEEHARDAVESLLQRYFTEAKVVGKADSVESAYTMIVSKKPDLVFLDIRLGASSGFDLLRRFESISFLLIFITGHEEYAVQAFKVSAVDYLLKPFNPTEFAGTVHRVRNIIDKNLQATKVNTLIDQFFSQRGNFDVKTFEFRSMGNDYAIAYDEIIQIVGKDNYTEIRPYLKPEIRYYKNLAEVEALLNDDRFIRVHKSHLVHRGYVTHFDEAENMLVLVDHSKIKVSSRKAKEIKKIFPAK